MAHAATPTTTDLTTLLSSLPVPITLPGGFDVASEVAAAIQEFNERLGYLPVFQTDATPTVRNFDPPGPDNKNLIVGGSQTLLLGNGLVSCTSIYNGVDPANSDAGESLIYQQDYWLEPAQAPQTQPFPEPYTSVKFAAVQRGLPQSIVVTGIWGYCQGTIPDDIWLAMLNFCAGNVLKTLAESYNLYFVNVKDADTDLALSPQLLMNAGCAFMKMADRVIVRKRLRSGF
jgi:hypothetical protein